MSPLTPPRLAAVVVRQSVAILALVKCVAGLVALAVAPGATDATTPFPLEVFLLHVLVFSAAGAWLVVGGRDDERAQDLGVLFLVTATMFADRPLGLAAVEFANSAPPVFAALRALAVSAFGPWLVWRFALAFPRDVSLGRLRTVARAAVVTAAFLGMFAFVASAVEVLAILASGDVEGPGRRLGLRPRDSAYWLVWILFVLGALALAVRNTRRASTEERRRVRLFAAGLVVGFVPMSLDVLLEFTIAPFGRLMNQPDMRILSGWVLYPLFLSTPFTTGYAVLVNEALSVRLVVRRAVGYALARVTLLGLMCVPLVLLAWFLYENRAVPVSTLVQGPRPVVLSALVGATAVLLALRKRLMNALDRRFFREQYDARQILGGLIDRSRSASTVSTLSELLANEIDRGLHVDGVSLLLLDEARRQLVPIGDAGRPLPASSALAVLLSGSPEPLEVGLDEPRTALQRLPEEERRWLADSGFRLLVPISGAQGSGLAGAIGLGPKRSELPFSPEDRWLLTAIAGSSSMVLDNLRLRTPRVDLSPSGPLDGASGPQDDGLVPAGECLRCLAVYPGGHTQCSACGATLERAPLPHLLRGTFRIDRRVGAGGMGVVYLGVDLNLGRRVAIKTLPAVSPEHAHRLRREARAMGALHDEHLATIFGLEFWDGRPLLVVEYFEAGTLHERLHDGPLPVSAVLRFGIGLAQGLEHVHNAGILHRDVKPSNIGFTSSGTAKLLDFGLAKFAHGLVPSGADGQDLPPGAAATTQSGRKLWMEASTAGRMIGTPLYFSPETVAMDPADESVDLWALAMVLYESLAGRHPLKSASMSETFSRISRAEVPDIRDLRPECPAALAEFFTTALHRQRRQRPATALAFRQQLERISPAG